MKRAVHMHSRSRCKRMHEAKRKGKQSKSLLFNISHFLICFGKINSIFNIVGFLQTQLFVLF